ncbi:MAG: helix-turn-helix domain-containing protein [Alphaproteobacteria bacterium]|nr:helix-turn-helix domain-containing protein [Alphaproteobacteria bacterium]
MDEPARLTIGDLARATGTKVVTIRYYEKAGLLPRPPRSARNYRIYAPEHLHRLRFVRRCRALGFTLDQVRELLSLSSRTDRECAEVDGLAKAHQAAVEAKIADLERLAAELRRISNLCQGGRMADCRIIEALSS